MGMGYDCFIVIPGGGQKSKVALNTSPKEKGDDLALGIEAHVDDASKGRDGFIHLHAASSQQKVARI